MLIARKEVRFTSSFSIDPHTIQLEISLMEIYSETEQVGKKILARELDILTKAVVVGMYCRPNTDESR